MGDVFQLPIRNGFSEQECRRIAEVAVAAGAALAWLKTPGGSVLACFGAGSITLGTLMREQGLVKWYPRDALSPFLAHVSLDECLEKVALILCGPQQRAQQGK